jgi:pentose-5-phosphate-3-epimerase
MTQAISKIQQLRAMKPDLHISVDGGVNEKNAAELIAAGANVLVAGGGVFKADDKRAAIDALLKACGGAGVHGTNGKATKGVWNYN